jgi:hypothetical protein
LHQINDIAASAYAADVVSTTSVHTHQSSPPPQVNGVRASVEGDARKTAQDVPDSTARVHESCRQIVEDNADDADTSSTFSHSPPDKKDESTVAAKGVVPVAGGRPTIWTLVKVVSYKLGRNPNTYASVGAIIWACIANRYTLDVQLLHSVKYCSYLILSTSY